MLSRFPPARFSFVLQVAGAALLLGFTHMAQSATAQADFSGAWTVSWCDKNHPATECGGFTVHLVQKGDRICGTHNGATPGLSRIDDGAARSIIGQVVGRTAVLTIQSARSEGIYLVTARKRSSTIDWHRMETVKSGNGDTDAIANEALMHRLTGVAGDERQLSAQTACEAYWATTTH